QDALSTSADEVGSDGIVHAIELDYSDSAGAWVWSVKTLVDGTDHEVEIDADSGEVLDHEQESTDDQEQAVDLDAPMTFQDALAKAQDEVDGPVSGWKLEWDDGMTAYQLRSGAWVWSVKTLVDGTDHEVEIDADSGEVLDHEQESTDDQEQAVDLDAPMTFQDALAKAQDEVDGPVSGWKLEWDDGMTAYQL